MKTSGPLPPGMHEKAFGVGEARAAGISEKRLRGRDLSRPFHGVVAARRISSVAERCAAYATVLPVTGFFSGLTAAVLHGVPLPVIPCELDVSVAAPARAPRMGGIAGHSVQIEAGDVVVRENLPLSSVERTWCELSTILTVEQLVVAGDHLTCHGHPLTSVDRLQQTARRYPGRRGRAVRASALHLLDPFSESPQESRLRVRLAAGGITGFVANREILTTAGKRYRGDLVFAAEGVVLEYQGDHHRDPGQFRRDLSRQLDLQADGWTVVQLGPWDIVDPGLVRRVRAILASGSERRSRPDPDQSSLRSSAHAVSS